MKTKQNIEVRCDTFMRGFETVTFSIELPVWQRGLLRSLVARANRQAFTLEPIGSKLDRAQRWRADQAERTVEACRVERGTNMPGRAPGRTPTNFAELRTLVEAGFGFVPCESWGGAELEMRIMGFNHEAHKKS